MYQNLFCLSADLLCHLQFIGNFFPLRFALDENSHSWFMDVWCSVLCSCPYLTERNSASHSGALIGLAQLHKYFWCCCFVCNLLRLIIKYRIIGLTDSNGWSARRKKYRSLRLFPTFSVLFPREVRLHWSLLGADIWTHFEPSGNHQLNLTDINVKDILWFYQNVWMEEATSTMMCPPFHPDTPFSCPQFT